MEALHANNLLSSSSQASCGSAESLFKYKSCASTSIRDASPRRTPHGPSLKREASPRHKLKNSPVGAAAAELAFYHGALPRGYCSLAPHLQAAESFIGQHGLHVANGTWRSLSPSARRTVMAVANAGVQERGTYRGREGLVLDRERSRVPKYYDIRHQRKYSMAPRLKEKQAGPPPQDVRPTSPAKAEDLPALNHYLVDTNLRGQGEAELGDGGAAVAAELSKRESDSFSSHHVPLNLKFRPKRFKELVGQDSVVNYMERAMRNNQISQAYLFSGPRGTGKTSAARILAASLNCVAESENREPCGRCVQCLRSGKESLAVREIDGASCNGVESIREVLESVRYSAGAKYKVYIIDECHMLSTEAANLLLKTLEEPPRGVVFVLVTTDPNRLPQAVVSRCQPVRFSKVKDTAIVERMRSHAASERLTVEEDALLLIASHADGSVRDAEMMLERARLCGRDVSVSASMIEELEGLPPSALVRSLLLDMLTLDRSTGVMATVVKLLDSGITPVTILERLAALILDLIAGAGRGRKGDLEELAEQNQHALHRLQEGLVLTEERVRATNARDLWLKMNLCALARSSASVTKISKEEPLHVTSPAPSVPTAEPHSIGVVVASGSLGSAAQSAVEDAVIEEEAPGVDIAAPLEEFEAERATLGETELAVQTLEESPVDDGSRPDESVLKDTSIESAAQIEAMTGSEPLDSAVSVPLTDLPVESPAASESVVETVGEASLGLLEVEASDAEQQPQEEEVNLEEIWEKVVASVAAKTVQSLLGQKGHLDSLTFEQAVVSFPQNYAATRAEKGKKGIKAAFKAVLERAIEVAFIVREKDTTNAPPTKQSRGQASGKSSASPRSASAAKPDEGESEGTEKRSTSARGGGKKSDSKTKETVPAAELAVEVISEDLAKETVAEAVVSSVAEAGANSEGVAVGNIVKEVVAESPEAKKEVRDMWAEKAKEYEAKKLKKLSGGGGYGGGGAGEMRTISGEVTQHRSLGAAVHPSSQRALTATQRAAPRAIGQGQKPERKRGLSMKEAVSRVERFLGVI